MKKRSPTVGTRHARASAPPVYANLLEGITEILEVGRRSSARTVNAVMTATYWEIGRRIVLFEQSGAGRAAYGEAVVARLSADLTRRYGRGFGPVNLSQMKKFYSLWKSRAIFQTTSEKSDDAGFLQTSPSQAGPAALLRQFPLPWSAYVCLLAVANDDARAFYETEALRSGWSVRQLDRQIQSQFYERTVLSLSKAKMLKRGATARLTDTVSVEEQVKDPYVLEFLGLRDEYSENDLEEALIRHLEHFLLELGGEFCFVGRQRRLRIGNEWFRVDLMFYHRRLRCLVLIDLKIGRFSHADAGQMHMYLNYAAEHWTQPGENPPVGLILCAQKDEALARYVLLNLPNKVLAAEYRTALPDEKIIAAGLQKARHALERQRAVDSTATHKRRRRSR
jgi:predicted nuclease of restriction endonuclease-like (RecB) superfamily